MSITIKDMKMPKGCLECPFKEIGMSTMTQCQLIAGWVEYAKDGYERPTECPLEERKKGKWILADEQRQEDVDNGNYRFICSECGKSDLHSKAVTVSFCWNCGTDMRGEGNE